MSQILQPGQPVLNDVDPRAYATMVRDAARVDSIASRLDVIVMTPPAEGSPAETERAERLKAYAYDHAATALHSAVDHIRLWRNVLGTRMLPTYAHLTILRSAHEAALTAYWLADPTVDPATRLARGVAIAAADFDERRKTEEALGMTVAQPPGKLAVDRLADLMSAAESAGLTYLNQKGKRVLTVTVPSIVELFDLYEPVGPKAKGQAYYRLYSGYAHAKSWAGTLGAQQQAPYDDSGRTIALTESNDLLSAAATQRVVAAVDRALNAYERLFAKP